MLKIAGLGRDRGPFDDLYKARRESEAGQFLSALPLTKEIRSMGFHIHDLWDLALGPGDYAVLIPLLMEHLQRDYSLIDKEAIVRALTIEESRGVANRLILEAYHAAPPAEKYFRWACGNAIGFMMTLEDLEAIVPILEDEANGISREGFIKGFLRWQKSPERSLILAKAGPILQQLYNHPNEHIQEVAQKAWHRLHRKIYPSYSKGKIIRRSAFIDDAFDTKTKDLPRWAHPDTNDVPIIDALGALGLEVDSIWDLVSTGTPYPYAIPTLIKHLSYPYHPSDKEGIVRSLIVRDAKGLANKAMFEVYHSTPKGDPAYKSLRDACAFAMDVLATLDDLDAMLEIIGDDAQDPSSRSIFVERLRKWRSVKNRALIAEKSEAILKKLLDHPIDYLAKEAQKTWQKLTA